MFESLQQGLSSALKALSGKGRLTEGNMREGLKVEGPLPADSVFHEEARANFDIVICMFHDQALIPVKTLGFHEGVNATLGLPMVRTSPDHGTALSLAGSGAANPTSLISAIKLAALMAKNAQKTLS